MSLVTEEVKAKAEVHYGDEICQERSKFLFHELGFPKGLLPLKDMVECGYVEETGFVWLKQKKQSQHYFDKIGKTVSYAPDITAYVEKSKIKKLTGVKAKELLIWVTISEISATNPDDAKLVFKSTAGLSKTFPASAFLLEEEKIQEKKEEKK